MILALLLGLLNSASAAPSPQYFDVGATLGMPGGLNATGAYWRQHLGVRAVLGYGGYTSGAQLIGMYRFNEIRPLRVSHSLGLTFGHTEIADAHATWAGPIYELDLRRGFYLQAGLGVSPRTTVKVLPLFSLGFVRRIHPG